MKWFFKKPPKEYTWVLRIYLSNNTAIFKHKDRDRLCEDFFDWYFNSAKENYLYGFNGGDVYLMRRSKIITFTVIKEEI
jgi:hypothetical protein